MKVYWQYFVHFAFKLICVFGTDQNYFVFMIKNVNTINKTKLFAIKYMLNIF